VVVPPASAVVGLAGTLIALGRGLAGAILGPAAAVLVFASAVVTPADG